MEPSRFDELTKALATATSRRQALKAIAATTIGGILGLGGIGNVFARSCTPIGKHCNSKTHCCNNGFCDPTTSKCTAPTTTTTSTTTSTTTTTTTTSPPALGCTAGSICENACPDTTTPFCVCGTTMAGAPVCYLQQNGCTGPYCTSDADCGSGNACVNLNDGCGGCDLLSGGKGVCNPICTS